MKNILALALVAAFGFFSCSEDVKKDGEAKNDSPTLCECVSSALVLEKKYKDAEGDTSKQKEIEQEFLDLEKKCEKLNEGKSDEELQEMMKEAEKCAGFDLNETSNEDTNAEENPTLCDCISAIKEVNIKYAEVGDDQEKINQIDEDTKELREKCEKLIEGKSDEEQMQMMKEAEDCN